MTTQAEWTITEHRGRAGLYSLEADWRRLYGRMRPRTSLVSFEACAGYLDHCRKDPDQVRCLALRDGAEIRAICILEPRTEPRLGFRLGVWGVLWLSEHPIYADVLGPDDAARRAFVPMLAGYLRCHPEGRRLLALGPLEVGAALWEGADRLARADRCEDRTDPVRILDCREPYAQVEAGCSKKHRRALKVARKHLSEWPGTAFRVARGPQALAAELQVFMDVEASGWKGEAGSDVRHRRGLPSCYSGLVNGLAGETDYCEIHTLYAGDRCIASALATRTGATFSVLKIGYDQAHGQAKPGHLLIARMVELCCADPGIEQVNFMSETPWLHGWRSELVPQQLVYVNIGGWVGRILTALLRFRLGPLRRLARWLQGRPWQRIRRASPAAPDPT